MTKHRGRWFDADTIINNPNVPLDIFLPPDNYEHIHMLAAKDGAGLNIGVFFLRVHEWSIGLLTQTITLLRLRPELKDEERFGNNKDQESMKWLLEQPEFTGHIIYAPYHWFNSFHPFTWQYGEDRFIGDLLIHWAGESPDNRPKAMEEWFEKLEKEPEKHNVPLEKSYHHASIEAFWNRLRDGKRTVDEAQSLLKEQKEKDGELDEGVKHIVEILEPSTNRLAWLLEFEPYQRGEIDQVTGSIMWWKQNLEKEKDREAEEAQKQDTEEEEEEKEKEKAVQEAQEQEPKEMEGQEGEEKEKKAQQAQKQEVHEMETQKEDSQNQETKEEGKEEGIKEESSTQPTQKKPAAP